MNNGFEHIFDPHVPKSEGKSCDEKNMKKSFENLAWRNRKPLTLLQKEENKEILLGNLDRETAIAMKKKSWNLMDMCFKWKYITMYIDTLKTNGLIINDNDLIYIKDLFIKKKLPNIVYNSKEKCITSLSLDWKGSSI